MIGIISKHVQHRTTVLQVWYQAEDTGPLSPDKRNLLSYNVNVGLKYWTSLLKELTYDKYSTQFSCPMVSKRWIPTVNNRKWLAGYTWLNV